jgi:hypothetical protein
MLGVEPIQFLGQGLVGGLLVGREFGAFAHDPTQAGGVAVGEVQRGIDPAPALGCDLLGRCAELRGGEAVEQGRVLQPPAVVGLEQVAKGRAAGRLIGFDPHELRTTIRSADSALSQHAADLIGLAAVGSLDGFPDLHLPRMVMRHREGHELVKRDAVLGIDVEQRRGNRGEPQALTDHSRGDEEAGGDILLADAAPDQRLEGLELIERMECFAVDVLGEAVFLGRDRGGRVADVAGDRCGLRETLGLDQQFERPEPATAGRDLEDAGFHTVAVEHRADVEVLKKTAMTDILGQFGDRDAGLGLADVGLTQDELVEGDVATLAKGRDLLNGGCHVGILHDGRPRDSLSTSNPSRSEAPPSSSKGGSATYRQTGKTQKRKAGDTENRIPGVTEIRPLGRAASSPWPPCRGGRPDGACRARRR